MRTMTIQTRHRKKVIFIDLITGYKLETTVYTYNVNDANMQLTKNKRLGNIIACTVMALTILFLSVEKVYLLKTV